MRRCTLAVLAGAVLTLPSLAGADAVVLQNGRRIEVERAWYQGAEVKYERDGGVYGLPRSVVSRIETKNPAEPSPALSPPPGTPVATPFRLRYEGGLNEPLGMAVLKELQAAYTQYEQLLGFRPEEPVTVVLQLAERPYDGQMPGWAQGVNDGAIRVPVMGIESVTPRLAGVLRHELAHSFVTWRTGGNCPTWLQEGVAQWLEGGDPAREDGAAAQLVAEGRLSPLLTLEVPFQRLPAETVASAYTASLSAVAHILRLRGRPGLGRLLAALGDRAPSDEALPTALGLSYPEFQRSWEAHLAGLPKGPATPRSPGS